MKKRFFLLIFIIIIFYGCGEKTEEQNINVGEEFHFLLDNDNTIHIYGGGKFLTSIIATSVAKRDIKTFFFAGYTKFEKKYEWTKKSTHIRLKDDRVVWGNGVTMKYTSIQKGILKLTFTSISGNDLKIFFRCNSKDHFLGFGAQTYKTDQRGEYIPIWTEEEGIHKIMESNTNPLWMFVGNRHNSYYPIPYFYDPRGFSFLAYTYNLSEFDLCYSSEKEWSIEVDNNKLEILLLLSKTPKESIKKYTDLTGKPILPQKWYFSPWNDAIGGEKEVEKIANILRYNKIPSAVIWTEDWGGMASREGDAYRFVYNWDVGKDLYPDFETMVTNLHKMGFFFLVYFNSFLDPRSRIWNKIPHTYMVKHYDGSPYLIFLPTLNLGGLLDLSNPDARAWVENKMKQAISLGVNGWMADYGEWLPYDSVIECGNGAECHNKYPLLWHSLNLEVMDKYAPPGQFVYFTRSGYIGDQALTPVYWPGDQSTDFSIDDGLPTAIAVGINVGWSGTVMYGSDIAGYMSIGNPPSDKELFIRWTEFGAFSPVMRTHHGYLAFKNWNFYRDEETLQWYRYYAIWHQRLFPYLYSEAISSGRDGIPLIRHMYMEFQDPEVINLQTQYMLGPFLLIAPVEKRGAKEKEVYFPKGIWYDFWNGSSIISSGEWKTVSAPLSKIPVFVREGSIVELISSDIDTIEAPAGATNVTTLANRNNWREIRVYPGKPVTWEDYEGNIFTNHILTLPTSEKLEINGITLPDCTTTQPPCVTYIPGEIKIKVKTTDNRKNITIADSTGNYFTLSTHKNRWWEITIYRGSERIK